MRFAATAKNPDPRRRRCIGIYKVKDLRGRRRFVVSKYRPHGSGRLRMHAPNYRSAQALQTRIESSILDGTWKQFKRELAGGKRTVLTVRSFYERFLEENGKPRMRSWRSYEGSFKSLNAMLGEIPLTEFHSGVRRLGNRRSFPPGGWKSPLHSRPGGWRPTFHAPPVRQKYLVRVAPYP